MPHVPLGSTLASDADATDDLFNNVIKEIDQSVGEIMQTLDSYYLTDNTIFIFTSDNGPWLVYGNHAGQATPLREGKHTTFDGGARVPFIARWPGQIPGGRTSPQTTGLIDLLPTLVNVVGTTPPTRDIDGASMWPLLSGLSLNHSREAHYFYHTHELQAVRKGIWKLHLPHEYQQVDHVGRDGHKGTSKMRMQPLALYNLAIDPGESVDVSEKHPTIVEALRTLAADFDKKLQSEMRPAGKSNMSTKTEE